jgi:hypothetical protein
MTWAWNIAFVGEIRKADRLHSVLAIVIMEYEYNKYRLHNLFDVL